MSWISSYCQFWAFPLLNILPGVISYSWWWRNLAYIINQGGHPTGRQPGKTCTEEGPENWEKAGRTGSKLGESRENRENWYKAGRTGRKQGELGDSRENLEKVGRTERKPGELGESRENWEKVGRIKRKSGELIWSRENWEKAGRTERELLYREISRIFLQQYY